MGLERGLECAVLNRHWAAGLTTAMGGTATGGTTKAMGDMTTTIGSRVKGGRQRQRTAR
jgi:hypothetical protein